MESNLSSKAMFTSLHVYNSLSKSMEEFVPHTGNTVKWYMCGPTVYDEAHLGHAKNYM